MREDMNAYEAEKKLVYKGLVILAVVTIIEVIFSLFGKGHLGWKEAYYLTWVNDIVGFIIIVLSLYKAYYIVAYFMHLAFRSEEHTSELQSRGHLVCRLLLVYNIIHLLTLHGI